MPDITPSFTMQYERRMRAITESEYVRRLKKLWWNKIARTTPIEGKTERVTWFLDTALIEPVGPSGSGTLTFENMVTQTVEYPTYRHGKGIKIQRDQLEDLDGTGLDQAAKWSENIGNETAYYPQRLMSQLILNGANTDGSANAYDTVPFFAKNTTTTTIGGVAVTGHPYNPYRPSLGGYVNWYTGAASGSYPGALPIDDTVTVDVALKNLGLAISAIANVKMPNGIDPRFLTPRYILCPPRMAPRVRQLTDAKIIAQAAATGGGGADVVALIRGWELGEPVVANELAAAYSYTAPIPFVVASTGAVTAITESLTGSDTTYYIVCEEMQSTQLGGLLYVMRKPFKVNYYTGETQVQLDRLNEFEYHVQGRMSAQLGHPYTIHRFDST